MLSFDREIDSDFCEVTKDDNIGLITELYIPTSHVVQTTDNIQ